MTELLVTDRDFPLHSPSQAEQADAKEYECARSLSEIDYAGRQQEAIFFRVEWQVFG
jgi:hypothetical protein